jgi:endonuclease/exonuclease/phosphatase family metal-dependent hydrolase
MLNDVVVTEGSANTIILGDFNADCDYLSTAEYSDLDFNSIISWLIDDQADTNVATTSCAYDRIASIGTISFSNSGVYTSGIDSTISDHYAVQTTANINGNPFKIGSFNLQKYGPTKASDSTFTSTAKSIIQQFDIILVQEITSVDETVIQNIILNSIRLLYTTNVKKL